MDKSNTTTKRINVFLPADILSELKKVAEEKGTTVSGLVRMIVIEYLKEKK